MSLSELLERPDTIVDRVEELIAQGRTAEVSHEDAQRLLAAAVRLYATKGENEGYFPAVPPATLTATDAMIASTGLLRAVNVAVFELGLWQSWAH